MSRSMLYMACLSSFLYIARCSEDAAEIYNSIPQDERRYFLAYHLAAVLDNKRYFLYRRPAKDTIEIPPHLQRKYEEMAIPVKISVKFYQWIQKKSQLTDKEMELLSARGWYCKPPCYDLNNPGSNCCF